MDTEKVNKIWQVIKTVVEIILAALGGLATGVAAKAAGFSDLVSQLL